MAVDGVELGGEDDAGNQGEEQQRAVEGHDDLRVAQRVDNRRQQADDSDDPGQHGNEHGISNGRVVVSDGDQVADERGKQQRPQEASATDESVNESRHFASIAL